MQAHRSPRGLFLASVVLLSTPLLGQSAYDLAIDQPASAFTWTGNTSLGPIVGVPNNNFNLAGSLEVILTEGGGQAVNLISMSDADAQIVPDISGEVPNPFPFLPPLAELTLAGVSFTVDSSTGLVDAGGDFTVFTTLTATSGTMIVTAVGSTSNTDLTGLVSDPTTISGNLSTGGVIHIDAPLSVQFSFVDGATGVTGDVSLTGSVVANRACSGPSNYCVGSPNSAFAGGGNISATGSTSVFANDMVLVGSNVPSGQPGIFYYGPNQISTAFGNGVRCVGGTVIRMPPTFSNPSGIVSVALNPLTANGPIIQGNTWNFQYWFRDPAAGGANFNLTNALSVEFCP